MISPIFYHPQPIKFNQFLTLFINQIPQTCLYNQPFKIIKIMNKQLTQSEALFKIVRIFVVQYLASVHNYKSIQNEAINMLATHVMRLIKNMILEIKRLLIMQGRTEPNCLHQLFAVKQLGITDLEKLCAFVIDKRYVTNIIEVTLALIIADPSPTNSLVYSLRVPYHQNLETISKVFQNDYELANRYEKERHYSTIRVIRNPYMFNFSEDNEFLPFKCGIDEAFNKPAEFTYKNTVEKIEREKKNVENLVAFTRRENRKALGLYLDSMKEEQKPKKKVKLTDEAEDGVNNNNKIVPQSEPKKTKEFDFINFL